MTKTVVIAGALDTKGPDFAYLKELIEREGVKTLVVDFGVMGEPAFPPDVTRAEVAEAGGGDIAYLATGEHKDEAMRIMAEGLAIVVRRLYDEGKLDGIISMGGSGGTSIATTAMRALPIGVPKVMVSTVGGGDVSAYTGTKDITFMPSIVDVAGLNRISRVIYANAAGAIAGMVKMERPSTAEAKPIIVASMFGNTTPAVNHAKSILEAEGYEVLVFHATGTGGRVMESLITDGYAVGSLDITTTELADEVCGGVLSAGPERCLAAARAGIPAVLVPGCVDMANFWGMDTVPEKYRNRKLYQWNPNVTLLRTNVEENIKIGEMIARAANESKGPVAILIPLKGVSMLDSPGGAFWDPEADRACFDAIKRNLRPDIPYIELDYNINDPEFSGKVAETLLEMLRKHSQ
ncbi:Tm-1-like ATP-binding domain-containing protein [uncultured Thermanaerothrix sp.]|uniref:Tm-1-like ATP-binding domain-containing protein n=1 Tax=uncultured Thermanaerothrix sp. TaxID=1195149 RepID=UPI0026086BDF|nr:Tm-1-like ATP-binding domain-containing protein [uncultured Thermanaerothrix sp.]